MMRSSFRHFRTNANVIRLAGKMDIRFPIALGNLKGLPDAWGGRGPPRDISGLIEQGRPDVGHQALRPNFATKLCQKTSKVACRGGVIDVLALVCCNAAFLAGHGC